MSKGKHWSEYLLPIPMAVSFISILSLVTAQFNQNIKFDQVKPVNGWEYLKYDDFAPNLMKLQNLMITAFETSDEAMLSINVNSNEMNEQLGRQVQYAALDQDTPAKLRTKKKLLAATMKAIKSYAEINVEKSTATIQGFNTTSNFIGTDLFFRIFSIIIIILGELLEAMKGTDALTNDGKFFLFFFNKSNYI